MRKKNINRRQLFQQTTSLVGYASLAKLISSNPSLFAQTTEIPDYPVQKNLIWITMNGGWDILEITDPKPASTSGIDMTYSYNDAHNLGSSGEKIGRWLPKLASRGNDMVVVRGLSMGTTSHQAGRIYLDTGVLSNSGGVNAASIPAMIAAESSTTVPIIQLSGGTDVLLDRGIVKPVSVVRAQNLDLYRSLYPEEENELALKLKILDYINSTATSYSNKFGSNDRILDILSAESKIRGQLNSNISSKLGLVSADTAPFLSGAPSTINNNQMEGFALALKLIKNQLVTSVNLGIGGFDTHSNQDRQLEPILGQFDHFMSVLIDQLKASNLLDSTLIVCFSDFGRTPLVNNNNGRDHWPTGGAFMIGGGIDGGRVVGATDDSLMGIDIHPDTGVPDTSSSKIQLNPTHLCGSVLGLTLGNDYLENRTYLTSIKALTKLKGSS